MISEFDEIPDPRDWEGVSVKSSGQSSITAASRSSCCLRHSSSQFRRADRMIVHNEHDGAEKARSFSVLQLFDRTKSVWSLVARLMQALQSWPGFGCIVFTASTEALMLVYGLRVLGPDQCSSPWRCRPARDDDRGSCLIRRGLRSLSPGCNAGRHCALANPYRRYIERCRPQ